MQTNNGVRRPRILLVWPYRRQDWIEVFRLMQEDFQFIFLSSIHPGLDEVAPPAYAEVVYWHQFQNAAAVLEQVRPEKIVFMSLDSALSIALNVYAQTRQVQTYILQHGIYSNYKDYRVRERQWKKNNVVRQVSEGKREVSFSTGRFMWRSLVGWRKLILIPFVLYTFFARKKGYYWSARYFNFSGKKPSFFICFSPRNAIIHQQLEKAKPSELLFIGSPELDRYLMPASLPAAEQERFFLHIDQAFAEHSMGEELASREKMTAFYLTLNNFCLKHQARLYIKLHPESYKTTWFPQHPNIVYLKHVPDFNAYIQGALGCFGFYSTMVIPAVYWKKVNLFRLNYSFLQEQLEHLGIARVLDFWRFDESEISFDFEKSQIAAFEREFFYKTDGKSLDRLREILMIS